MEHIIKEYNEQHKFYKLTPEEGYVISTWNEGDDILEYGSFTIAYCPANADFSIYHTFTVEQDEAYKKAQEEAAPKPEEIENNNE